MEEIHRKEKVAQYEEIMKREKRYNQFFNRVRVNKSTIYFKMNLYRVLMKYPVLEKSILLPHYFKNNFEMIKAACNDNVNMFTFKG